jgi:hypothetical protein
LISFFIIPIVGFSLLLSPFIIIIFFILLFSANFIWIALTICIFYGVICFYKLYKWFKLPTYDEYIMSNKNDLNINYVICSKCGNHNLSHVGLFYRRSKLRFYVCQVCGKMLYRFKLI